MGNAEKLSITLPLEMVQSIREKVSAGAYSSTSEVIRAALRSWLENEKRLRSLDGAIALGMKDAEAGRVHSTEKARAKLLVAKKRYPSKVV